MHQGHAELIEEAARILCVEQLLDYQTAKLKAAQRLGYPRHAPLPDNAAIEAAVIAYQQLFGGEAYHAHLRRLRLAALQIMRLLAPFSPHLVGGAVSGAVTLANRAQLHVFADAAEMVEIHLLNQRQRFTQGERDYHFGRQKGARAQRVPLIHMDGVAADARVGVDIAVFEDLRTRAPINPADGEPYRRLDPEAVRKLLEDPAPARY